MIGEGSREMGRMDIVATFNFMLCEVDSDSAFGPVGV